MAAFVQRRHLKPSFGKNKDVKKQKLHGPLVFEMGYSDGIAGGCGCL